MVQKGSLYHVIIIKSVISHTETVNFVNNLRLLGLW